MLEVCQVQVPVQGMLSRESEIQIRSPGRTRSQAPSPHTPLLYIGFENRLCGSALPLDLGVLGQARRHPSEQPHPLWRCYICCSGRALFVKLQLLL